jgi:hypothetical protein
MFKQRAVSLVVSWGLMAGLLALPACGVGRHVQTGISYYSTTNYPSAMGVWREIEPRESEMNPKGLVRYLVYRGLTHYRLGEKQAAAHFLSRGAAMYRQSNPQYLPDPIVAEMQRALGELGSQAPQSPVPPVEPETIQ